jgi:hypothetical protein
MSISNLRKHDAIMERLKADQANPEMSQEMAATATLPRKGRTTRSRATRSPSPSASSAVSISSVLTAASTSTITSTTVNNKRRGGAAAAQAAEPAPTTSGKGLTRSASTRTAKTRSSTNIAQEDPTPSKATSSTHDKTLKADDLDSVVLIEDEKKAAKWSPTSSVFSITSSAASDYVATTRTLRRNRKVKEDLDQAGAAQQHDEQPGPSTLTR